MPGQIETTPREAIGANEPPLADRLEIEHAAIADETAALAKRADAAPKEVASDADVEVIGGIVKDARALTNRARNAHKIEKEPYLTGGKAVDAFFKVFTERLDRIVTILEGRASAYHNRKAEEERRRRAEEAARIRAEEDRKRLEAEKAKREATQARKIEEADRLSTHADAMEASAAAPAADMIEKTRTASGVSVSAETKWEYRIVDYQLIPLDKLRPYLKREEVEKAIRSFVRINKNAEPLSGVEIFEDIKTKFR